MVVPRGTDKDSHQEQEQVDMLAIRSFPDSECESE